MSGVFNPSPSGSNGGNEFWERYNWYEDQVEQTIFSPYDLDALYLTLERINRDGLRRKKFVIKLTDGDFFFTKPLVYNGRAGEELYVIGSRNTSLYGSPDFPFLIKAVGGTIHLQSFLAKLNGPVIILDAENAEKPGLSGHYNSTLKNLRLFSNSSCVQIGHFNPLTSQVREIVFDNVVFRSNSTNSYVGIGVDIRCGGNTKNFTFRDCKFNGLSTAINWPLASGFMELTSINVGQTKTIFVQGGGGAMVVNGLNAEWCGSLIRQSGGIGPVGACFNGVEFLSQAEDLPSFIHGPCIFNCCTVGSDSVPIHRFFLTFPLERTYQFNGVTLITRNFNENLRPVCDTNGNSLTGPVYKGRKTGVKMAINVVDQRRGRNIFMGD